MMAAVRRYLDLSTTHLRSEDIDALKAAARRFAGPATVQTEDGWFVWAPDEPEAFGPDDLPDNLRRVLSYARAHGCDRVLFDRGAEVDEHLFAWQQDEEASA
jgi:hypothetical protein